MTFLRVLCVVCGLLLPAFGLDREGFTFTKYDLNVRLEPEQQRIGVRGKITLRNDSGAAQKNLSLQISSSLSWHSITEDGKPLQFLTQPYISDVDHTGALSEAIVSLAQDCPAKGAIELEIGYEGIIPLDATRLTQIGVPAVAAKRSDWDQIGPAFTAVRGAGYVAWYPVAMEAASLSDGNSVTETIARWKAREAPAEMRLKIGESGEGSGGNPSGENPRMTCNAEAPRVTYEGAGRSLLVSMECSFAPLEAAVPLFVIGNYESLPGAAVDVSYLGDHKTEAAEFALAAEKVLPFLTDWIGAPHRKPEVLELPDSQAAPYDAGSMLLTPLNHVPASAMELTAVHQLTHAAFYSPRPWVDEGLAHFAQALYRESEDGRQAGLDFMELHRAILVDTEKSLAAENGKHAPDQLLAGMGLEDLYRSKAMYVWWMLRDMVTAPALKKALANYHPDQDREPSYLQRLLEAQSKRELQWFFDDWVYHDKGLPDFRVASVFPQQTPSGSYVVTVVVENLGGAGAEVPVTVRAQGGETTLRLEVRGNSKNAVRFTIPSPPLEIIVNDGSVPESDLSNNVYKVEPPVEHR